MLSKRLVRINELLRREIADVLFREMTETGFDLASVTVTRVEVAPNLRSARVSVSVRGDDAHRANALAMLRRHRGHIQRFVNRDLVLKYTPVLHFVEDRSIAQGDRILHLIQELVPPEDEESEATPDAPEPPENPHAEPPPGP
jgi:ribosome-binding factor A